MTGNFLADHADDPYVIAMTVPVVLFGWLSVRPSSRSGTFFSARLAAALGVMVPAAIFCLVKLNREITLASFYPTDNFYTNRHRVLEARQPLAFGLIAALVMLSLHTALCWAERRRSAGRGNHPLP